MYPLLLAVVLVSPVGAFVWLLSRRRDWRTLMLFLLVVGAIVGATVAWGYEDYRSSVGSDPLLSDRGVEFQVTMFAVLGAIAADWLALIWGAWYWLSGKRGRVTHRTRADRRREARTGAVASPRRGMPE